MWCTIYQVRSVMRSGAGSVIIKFLSIVIKNIQLTPYTHNDTAQRFARSTTRLHE